MSRSSAHELQGLMQRFVRQFGLLDSSQTPCGKPLSISYAHALMALRSMKAGPTQSELQAVLCIDKSNIARLCMQMEKLGHLKRSRSAGDGRAWVLRLTKKGEVLADSVSRASIGRFAKLFESLPPGGRGAALSGLRLLVEAIENENQRRDEK